MSDPFVNTSQEDPPGAFDNVELKPNTEGDPATKPDPKEGEEQKPAAKEGGGEVTTSLGDDPEDEEQEFKSTGDVGMDVALKFMGKLGIKLDDPAVVAAKGGDFGLIRAKLSTMGTKAAGWEEHVKLVEQSFERHKDAAKKRDDEVVGIVVGVAGSKEKWAQVQAWARENADDNERVYYNGQFAQGGLAAKKAAEDLVRLFDKKHGSAPANPTKPDAGSGKEAPSGPYTAKQYAEDVRKLQAAAGGRDISGSQEYRALQDRRLASKRQGN